MPVTALPMDKTVLQSCFPSSLKEHAIGKLAASWHTLQRNG